MDFFLYIALGLSLSALVYAFYLYKQVLKAPVGSEKVAEISGFIKEGATAFLKKEYFVIIIFVIVAAPAIALALGIETAFAFVLGALFSAFAGIVGMKSATDSNSRTATAAEQHGMQRALGIAFKGGAVMGMSVVGFGLLGVIVVFYVSHYFLDIDAYDAVEIAAGYSLGASSIALFGRVGGGIFTKAADVGADLVGKVEAGIPEDDPRNPAVIADNVGDNVGDVAGMGSDLLESYVSSIIGAATIGAIWYATTGVIFVLIVAGMGVLSSMIGSTFVKGKDGSNPHKALKMGTYISGLLFIIAVFFLNWYFIKEGIFVVETDRITHEYGPFISVVLGLGVGLLIGLISEYYTSAEYKHVKSVAKQSETGHATNIISGMAIGMESTALPVILIAIGTVLAFNFGGLFGIGLAAVGMLGTAGMTVGVDAYGPIADNAGGIAQMANMDPKVRKITDELDSVGNTTAAIAKGFAIGSAALTALALFSAFTLAAGLDGIDITKAPVIAGLMIGGMLAFLFSSLLIKSVGKAANEMIEEVRRQFREIPGILEGTGKPDYAKCVSISTTAALKEMILPALLAVASPLVVGFLFGAEALGGMLAGTLITGIMLAIFMANSGGAWDNAKKYIEQGNHGGKGSLAHSASVTGDTVGDPFKDTSGPAIDILIKLMTTMSLVFATLFGAGIL
ncbi:MAG: putative K(+)-stimulated pyrophosphate-energized sodium pump [Candidatus Izimaplasma bacterium HR2]|nr:MAG: putative K(+)-stimulated pyrophosphate-energized sodium pump [Candidatus Izimaplasma bacterium HR2]